MTVTIPVSLLVIGGLSALLFLAVTVLAWRQKLFGPEGGGYFSGLQSLFVVVLYAMFWAIPSLAGWAIYATWFATGSQP